MQNLPRFALLLSAVMVLAACATPTEAPTADNAATDMTPAKVGMPNPASVHCKELGGTLEIRTGKDGGQFGVCTLPDGKVCEEWALFRDKKCVTPSE
ncbi:putative hemolysin [Lysobacter sp. CA196]|uniref:putative hemolysin n=1 Tax=Lysobacter sp. CA196 TaxID=3455606 RepID=UPI003F8D5849